MGVREDHCDVLEHDFQSFCLKTRTNATKICSQNGQIFQTAPHLLQTSTDATSNCLLLSLLRSSVGTAVHRTKGPLSLPSILTGASNYIIVLRRHSQTLVTHVYAVQCNCTMFAGECVSTVTRRIE